MDHKMWHWKRKSVEKTVTASNEHKLFPKGNREQTLVYEKAELQKELTALNEKLSLVLIECDRKDDFAKHQTEVAKNAIEGQEKAEAEARSLKQEVEKAVKRRLESEERLTSLDAPLKECKQQLRFVREEQEKRIYDAIMKTSREFEEIIIVLEERLAETSKKVTMLGNQNTQLRKALIVNENVIKGLQEHTARSEANFRTLITRLESTEKENASLKYEIHVVEKELDIRNEEKEFNRRTTEITHKKHLESVKKIAKLESDCQRLRLLVRKRLPGPADLAKMKFEVETLAPAETRSRKSSSSIFSMDLAVNAPDTPIKRIDFLAKQLSAVKEENKILKEALTAKANNLQLSENIFDSSTSRFSEVEAQLDGSSKGPTVTRPTGNFLTMHELSLASMSDMESDGKLSCTESMSSKFIRGSPSSATVEASGISLMDDFVEMENLAVVSTDESSRSAYLTSDGGSKIGDTFAAQSSRCISEATGLETLPIEHVCESSVFEKVIQTEKMSNHIPVWVDDIVKLVLEQSQINQKSPDAILDVIKVAMACSTPPEPCESVSNSLSNIDAGGCNRVELPDSIVMHSPDRSAVDNMFTEKSNQQFQLDLSKSVSKIIKLVEGVRFASPDHNTPETLNTVADCSMPCKVSESSAGYMVRVFQWKASDLSVVLQKFVQICNEILNGNADVQKFIEELTSFLEWIANHCVSLQDVSSMRDAIKENFDWNESQSDDEIEDGMNNHFPEASRLHASIISEWKCHDNILHLEENLLSMGEHGKQEDELSYEECGKDSTKIFQSIISTNESLSMQLRESEKTIDSLQVKLEVLSQSNKNIENQYNNLKSSREYLDAELIDSRAELSECCEKLSHLEGELENKNMVCEELEAACLDLQLQLESMKQEESLNCDTKLEKRRLQNDLEITSASENMAECQETKINLGRQLYGMGSPTDASFCSKVAPPSTNALKTTSNDHRNKIQKTSLLDKILAEDSTGRRYQSSPTTKEVICTSNSPIAVDGTFKTNDIRQQGAEGLGNSFAIIPGKEIRSRGLWKNLLRRLKKGHSRKEHNHTLHNNATYDQQCQH